MFAVNTRKNIRFATLAMICVLATQVYAQTSAPTTSLTNVQIAYFVRFFSMVGSPDVATPLLNNNRVGIGRQFGFNAAESSVLQSAADSYQAQMGNIRAQEKAIVSAKATLVAADRMAIAQLIQSRDALVNTLAAKFLASIRPATASRLLADAQVVLTRKGAH